ncbi:MAG: amino acid adenylation domain-containing protein [Pseudomonadales bacterium]|nr:amino acid adenylation domain-containing protein [Pseudomonadales bacterium]
MYVSAKSDLNVQTLVDLLQARAKISPDRVVYTFLLDDHHQPRSITYAELDQMAKAVAVRLTDMDAYGQRALMLYPSGSDFLVAFLGCLYAGVVCVPAYPPRKNQNLERLQAIIDDCQPRIILGTSALLSAVEPLLNREGSSSAQSIKWLSSDTVVAEEAAGYPYLGLNADKASINGETLAFLQYTSGSTDTPKGVMVSHRNILQNQAMMTEAFHFDSDTVIVSWLPLFHDLGLIGAALLPILLGGSAVLMSPATFLQKPVRWLQAISKNKKVCGVAPNFAFELCIKQITDEQKAGLDLSGWKWALSGAETVRKSTLDAFSERFADVGFRREAFCFGYGLAEATLFVTGAGLCEENADRQLVTKQISMKHLQSDHVVAATKTEIAEAAVTDLVGNGQPQLDGQVMIVDVHSEQRLPDGAVGEVWVRGSHVAKGYWEKPKETKEIFQAYLRDPDGQLSKNGPYLRTGDLGSLLEGSLFITGREKDLMIIRGRNHYPQDVEHTVQKAHKALKLDAGAAFTIDVEGEEKLVVVQELERRYWRDLEKLLTKDDIVYQVRKGIAEKHEIQLHSLCFLQPGRVLKTTSGKIQRRANKKAYQDGTLKLLQEIKRESFNENKLRNVNKGHQNTKENNEQRVLLSPLPFDRNAFESLAVADRVSQLMGYLSQHIASVISISQSAVTEESALVGLGFDSILVAQLASRLRERYGVELQVHDLIDVASVRDLTIQVMDQIMTGAQACEDIPTSIQRPHIPLSYAQQRIWFLEQVAPHNSVYNLMFAMEIEGTLRKECLVQSFEEIIARHEILRSVFLSVGGVPHQVVNDSVPFNIPFEDLSTLGEQAKVAAIQGLATVELARPFDLEAGPLLRARLIRLSQLGGDCHVLLITAHHIVSDGWSMGIFVNELDVIYRSLLTHENVKLKKPEIQYKDYAHWQRTILDESVLEKEVEYWRQQLTGVSDLELPTQKIRPPERSGLGGDVHFTIGAALTQKIKKLGQEQGATLFMVLLASFKVLLHRYSGSNDICVGSPIAGRTRAELENLIGFFVNTLALRTHCEGDASYIELLQQVRDTSLAAYAHQNVPFERLVDELVGRRDMSYTPLFQVMFAMQNTPVIRSNESAGTSGLLGNGPLNNAPLDKRVPVKDELSFRPVDIHTHTAKFDLSLSVEERGDELKAIFEYSADLFDEEYVTRLASHWENILESLLSDPQQSISQLNMLGDDERHHLISELNDNVGNYPRNVCLHQLFEQQVAKSPEAIAVIYEDEQWTYSAINAKANQIARHLRELGVNNESLVAISVDRNIDMIVGLLSILKVGAAYVPLDPEYPKERVAYMLEDSLAPVVICHHHLKNSLPKTKILCLDRNTSLWEGNDISNLGLQIDSTQLCYVMYTSGSTGKPKGVAVEHRNVASLVQWAHTAYHPQDLSGVLFSTSICFDLSVWELFVTLTGGGTVIMADSALSLPTIPSRDQVTLMNTVPSAMVSLMDDEAIPHSVKIMNSGGEAISPAIVDRLYSLGHIEKVYDLYGPTEAAVYSMRELRKANAPASIGRPIMNTATYIVDQAGQLVPKGIPGELYLGGWGVARGYRNRDDLTAEKFITNPFVLKDQKHPEGYDRIYRTGDNARYLEDGRLEYLGRMDHQVKIRGFRIELGEVEHALNRCSEVSTSLVVVSEDESGEKNLIAYWIPNKQANHVLSTTTDTVSDSDLRASIREMLPEYMMPVAFIALEKFPLTPNGKIDRKQLPKPEVIAQDQMKYVAPETPLEIGLASIWRNVLKCDVIGRHNDFFKLGGHSLLATQVVSRIRDRFQVELLVRDIFRAPTIAALAELIDTMDTDGRSVFPSIEKADRNLPIPLSSAQQRLWFLDKLESGSSSFKIGTAYNIAGAIKLTGELNVTVLRSAFTELVKRHEALRTNVKLQEGQVVQVIGLAEPSYLDIIDLTHINDPEQSWRVKALMIDEATRAFDIEISQNAKRTRLLRTRLLKLSDHQYVVLVTMHHIVSDGWSMGLLLDEVVELYDAKLMGRLPQLPDLPIQYADYAVWQQSLLSSGALDQQTAYWREQLQNVPVLMLPTDRSRPPVQSSHGSRVEFKIDKTVTSALTTLSQQHGVTLFMTLLAGFKLLLQRYSQQDDFCVGTPIANRTRAELEPLMGCFVNTLALRTQFHRTMTVQDLLLQVRNVTLAAYAHQDLPFEVLVDELDVARDLSRSPLIQVMFTLQNTPQDYQVQLKGLGAELLPNAAQSAKFDLSLNLTEVDDGFVGEWEYSSDLFERSTIESMISHFQQLLSNMTQDVTQRIDDVRMLSEIEETSYTRIFEDDVDSDRKAETKAGTMDKTLHQLFEQQVDHNPTSIALTWQKQQLTYQDLNNRSNQLAHYLVEQGIGSDCLVGICVDRSVEMIVALLAVLKAGAAYLPIDTSNPTARISTILEDGLKGQKTALVISHDAAIDRCLAKDEHSDTGTDFDILNLDIQKGLIEEQPTTNLSQVMANTQANSHITDQNKRAYVIYTSGTTGTPKGVVISHGNATRLFSATEGLYSFADTDVWTLFHSLAFDFSVWEIWGALLHGGRLVIVPYATSRSPDAFYDLLVAEEVTVLNQTPSSFSQLIKVDADLNGQAGLQESGTQETQTLPNLRHVIFGGEALDFAALQEWQRRHSLTQPQLTNMYGITETTVHVTSHRIQDRDLLSKASFIGQAIDDLQVILLDSCMRPVPVGVPGEIYVGGAGVASGYLHRPELSAKRFIDNPYQPGTQLYKTGDLARWTKGHQGSPSVVAIQASQAIQETPILEYLGRTDDQVKIRGYRIELGEIESTISQQPTVRENVVIVREDKPGDKRLVAYITQAEEIDLPSLRIALGASLPQYMIPSAFVLLDSLPVTSNGKIDKGALLKPTDNRDSSIEYVEPRNQTEQEIVALWCHVLDLQKVGVRDNFFDVGGNSLLATQLVSRIRDEFDVELALSILFEQPTIEYIALQIVEAEVDELDDAELAALLTQIEGLEDEEPI